MKATFIVIRKNPEIITIFVREDKKVLFNFGSDIWINFLDMKNQDKLHTDRGKNKKYKEWVESKKFKKDYNETIEVMKNNDYHEVVNKFIHDFKKDRVPVFQQEVEIDPSKSIGDING